MKNNPPKIVGKENILDIDREVAQITAKIKPDHSLEKEYLNTKHKNYVAQITVVENFYHSADELLTDSEESNRSATPYQSHKTDTPSSRTSPVDSDNLSDQKEQRRKKPGYCIVS